MKTDKLRRLIDYHNSLPFPEHPDSEELSSWILDLSECDAYYLGIAHFYLANEILPCKLDFSHFNKIKSRLECIIVSSNKDKLILNDCKDHLNSIFEIIEFLRLKIHHYKCPCCGFLTLSEKPPGTFEICPVCFWEDDIVQFENPDYEGGANEESLHQAQKNFLEIGASSEKHLKHVRKPKMDEFP